MSSVTNKAVTLDAPCKVNLTLDVGLPRADGFHDIDSIVAVFAPPADDITVRHTPGAAKGVLLICKHVPDGFPKGPENLAHRAAVAFQEQFQIPGRVFVKLDKRLPVQAGLGGGSSDAAAVLIALNRLTEAATMEQLRDIAASLGSDVPLFLQEGQPVRMRGRGELIDPLPHPLPTLYGVLVKPEVGVPTGPAYAALDALPDRAPGESTLRFLDALAKGSGVRKLASLLHNDFESAILPAYPDVAAAHRSVKTAGALRALLSGSGSAIFGLAESRDHARTLVKNLCGQYPWVKMATSIIAVPDKTATTQ
ncbi:MAG: 4-(cytidine 5'-diphospho)-2-C-methyl-D-erythritol kinase [Armatimonadota bacterium]